MNIEWIDFYEDVARKLFSRQEDPKDRKELIKQILDVVASTYGKDKHEEGRKELLQDICPFTTLGSFNRSSKSIEERKKIAESLADLLDVKAATPESFEGIPVLKTGEHNSWYFRHSKDREKGDIETLWKGFAAAMRFVESDANLRDEFVQAFNAVEKLGGVDSEKLSIGLHWARPRDFPSLDEYSRKYLSETLNIPSRGDIKGEDYLKLIDKLKARFKEESCPVRSFPELSWKAWNHKDGGEKLSADTDYGQNKKREEAGPYESYSFDQLFKDGCFHDQNVIEDMRDCLQRKKNLILQGPPGTGKTWMARRLAYLLMEGKKDDKIRAVQFHPNLSYEDFVRGYRPTRNGQLEVADGVFLEAIRNALDDPYSPFFVIIEEINRGNPAQIFGELLTLLEADKRKPNEALELSYVDPDGERKPVYIPENLYVIGTMNIADRSLALIDLAFRRRFAFVTLPPMLGNEWRKWVVEQRGVDESLAEKIGDRIGALNMRIADESLGDHFQIGHSYVTPDIRLKKGMAASWFIQVARTEIRPLLEEYWFDSPNKAADAIKQLVDGLK